ncbi:KLTH0G10582p [Lachancea thermotolerans CBS 6340]|uniref:KLTH0G10582p n=1 Tax=Lachancea thermotolerans (strain ATCC 56472 / CBS 6340 / NRRL Y-8284) TaxID=559295 RepID=C5DMP5_LACTC|nr:KLTH0G10582p [Lachancea thermotolerans CBS 6340]CAR25056.1 KLTH0G10582p [Lachancea thermotolerans CBS 6340]
MPVIHGPAPSFMYQCLPVVMRVWSYSARRSSNLLSVSTYVKKKFMVGSRSHSCVRYKVLDKQEDGTRWPSKELGKPEMSSELKQRKVHAGQVATGSQEPVEKQKHRRQKKVASRVDRYSCMLSTAFFALLYLGSKVKPEFTSKFTTLQYKYADVADAYDIGIDDAYMVVTCIVALVMVRSFLLEFVLKPIALRRFHIQSRKSQQRYAEQGWSLVYYTFSWVLGFYLYCQSPYFLNCDHIYLGWPHDRLSSTFKMYYLLQISSWLQQIVVLNVEERRKDYWQMFAHHIITCLLTLGSYYYYFTRIGHVILIMMDIVDVFLSSAKMLKYCGFTTACDYMFAVFLVFWVLLRHIAYNYIFYHAGTKAPGLMSHGQCMASAVQKRCWTPLVIDIFLWLLGGLQVITIIWMALIIKVLIKILKGGSAEDVRSDEDDSD